MSFPYSGLVKSFSNTDATVETERTVGTSALGPSTAGAGERLQGEDRSVPGPSRSSNASDTQIDLTIATVAAEGQAADLQGESEAAAGDGARTTVQLGKRRRV